MASIKQFIKEYAGPALIGLVAALLFLGFPGLQQHFSQSAQPTHAIGQPFTYADAVSRAAPTVVNIYSLKQVQRKRHPLYDDPIFRSKFNRGNQSQQERMLRTLGSGVIIRSDGYILTNIHVIQHSDQILVHLYDGREAQARIVGTDPATDLAVLKIDAENLNAIPIADVDRARIGDVVLAIGNPFGYEQTVTQGIISASRIYADENQRSYQNWIQTDAAINPGNSGGALVDAYGRLLGINTRIDNRADYAIGIGFAIPADTAVKVLNDILEMGFVAAGWLGIESQPITQQMARTYRLEEAAGVMVISTINGGPASEAGIQAGDVVTHINGKPIGMGGRHVNPLSQTRPGDQAIITLWRNGQPIELDVTLALNPMHFQPKRQ